MVNRLIGRREAIVEATPGVTRDRGAHTAEWGGRRFEVMDTGGLEPGAAGLDARVAEQASVAIETADLILLVVDASTGPVQDDVEVAALLRKSDRPVMLVVNKADRPADAIATADFFGLALGDPVPVSALHGSGSGDLLDQIVKRLPERPFTAVEEWASVAVVGRPNTGKSSILNALLGEERAIVHHAAGTTRDPVDSYLRTPGDRLLRVVDTAGMRRQVQLKDPIEYFSWLRSRRTLERVDAAVLVVDAAEGVTHHDQRIAEEIVATGRACVVALNKWDLKKDEEEADRVRSDRHDEGRLRFLEWATRVRTSAVTKRGIDKLLPAIEVAVESHRRRLPTSTVNRLIRAAQAESPHPRTGGRPARIMYAVQARVAPPTVLVFSKARLEPGYLRYLESRIRVHEPFHGSPLRIEPRAKSRPEAEG